MTAVTSKPKTPAFCEGIQHFADALPDFDDYGQAPAIAADAQAITDPTDPAAVYQTLLAADALRYLTLQMTASKQSGHPGGFASIADTIAALSCWATKTSLRKWVTTPPAFTAPYFWIAP
jgi:phosphoketolase